MTANMPFLLELIAAATFGGLLLVAGAITLLAVVIHEKR
jgi:hypothetical protein